MIACGLLTAQAFAQDRFLEGVLRPEEVSVRAKVIDWRFPDYVGKDLSGDEGVLRIEFVIELDGSVRETRVAQERHPELVAGTVAALKTWKFLPATKDGQPARTVATAVVDFKIRPRPSRRSPRTALTALISVEGADDDFAKGAVDWNAPGIVSPRVMRNPRPEYPRGVKAEGVVRVEAIVGVDGTITAARIVQSVDPRLDAAALTTARNWTFAPATKDSKPVPARIELLLEFRRQ